MCHDVAQPQEDERAVRARELLGVHPQPQSGLNRVGIHVPVGRSRRPRRARSPTSPTSTAGGEVRLTVEQNIILPNVAE